MDNKYPSNESLNVSVIRENSSHVFVGLRKNNSAVHVKYVAREVLFGIS